MQTVRRAIIADIGDELCGGQPFAEGLLIGALMGEAALARRHKKRGTRCRHDFVI